MESANWDELDKLRFYTIGPLVFLGVRAAVYPISLVKTRLQVQRGHSLYNGQVDAFVKILRHEGARGLYKGFLVNCWGILGGQFYITVYELMRSRVLPLDYAESLRNFVAGASASLTSQTLVVPLDVVSQKMMIDGQGSSSHKLRGSFAIAREIVAEAGARGLFRGYFASVMTYAPSSAIWWSTYPVYRRAAHRNVPRVYGNLAHPRQMLVDALGGGAAGATAAVLTNPMDVVRARLQVYGTRNTTFFSVARELVATEGPAGFLKGATARVTSMAPSSMLVVTAYETVKRLSHKERPLLRSAAE